MSRAATRGREAENLVARWLEAQGLKLVARNVRYRFGEIDLVMDDGEALVFVEVRYRSRNDFGGAAASVTAAKRARMERAIRAYVASHREARRRTLRADVVAVSAGDEIEWIKNALEATT
ncbi:MAG: YraN family protein [Gammaproteobacteria bacterium]